jgi:deoxyribonuclease-4
LEASPGKTMILLENMAGQGTNLGYKFEQLKQIIDNCKAKYRKRLGACFDTCHAFAAGYDISTPAGYKKTIKELDTIIGLELVKVIHLNDSFGALGSRVDRHAPLGAGKIPLAAFELIMNDKKLWKIPKILETPSDSKMQLWASEIKLLKKMVKDD